MFLFDLRAAWAWLSLQPDERTVIERQLKALILPKRCNAAGIRQRLSQNSKLDTDETSTAILRPPGGWPYLLDVLFYRCGPQKDPTPISETIENEFPDNSTKLGHQFRHCLGLDENEIARRVLKFIQTKQPVALNHVTPDAVGGTPLLSSSECWIAREYLQRTACVDLIKGEFSVQPIAGHALSLS